jgi:hypothetical protein
MFFMIYVNLSKIEWIRRAIELTCDAIELMGSTIELTYDAIELTGYAIELTCDAIELMGSAIALTCDAIELTGSAIELMCDAIELTGSAIELTGKIYQLICLEFKLQILFIQSTGQSTLSPSPSGQNKSRRINANPVDSNTKWRHLGIKSQRLLA